MSPLVVAVVAHPDDESLIAGGTLALAARAGADVAIVSLTRGELGPISDPEAVTRETLPTVREAELAAAGRILGARWTQCLRLPDGELPWVEVDTAAAQLRALVGPRAPEVVLTFGEDGLYGHPDHAAAAAIAHAAFGGAAEILEAAWSHATFPALAAAARERGLPDGLWGLEPEAFGCDREPVLTVDVGSVLSDKLAAIRAHRTQLDRSHLLAELPLELAARFLGEEPWAGADAARLKGILDRG